MALGKIKADTLEHSTAGSIATNFVVNGSAKAWDNNNTGSGGSLTSTDSLNISSRTDVATGRFALTVASAWANSWGAGSNEYNILAGTSTNTRVVAADADNTGTTTLNGVKMFVASSGSLNDGARSMVIMFGDLA
jgi:hypothetical protein